MKTLLALGVLVVGVLHQDFWYWNDATLVLGFLPIGFAWHLGYCFLATALMALLVRHAWPAHLEDERSPGP